MFGFLTAEAAPTTTSPPIESYASRDLVNFQAFGDKNIEILLGRHTGNDKITQWYVVTEGESEQVWRGTVVGSDWSPFRVKRSIAATKEAIEGALLDSKVLMELDDMTERIDVIHKADADGKLTLRQFTSKPIFPIASREFVVVTYSKKVNDNCIIIASRSIQLGDVEAHEGTVRARNIITGYIIEESKDANGKPVCQVTLVAHADLSGYIPATVVNMLGTSATVKMLHNLKNLLEKN